MSVNSQMNPETYQVIQPIIQSMTQIALTEENEKRMYGRINESDRTKNQKKSCVHIIYRNGAFDMSIEPDKDGKLRCTACGREINTKFDESAVKKLDDALTVINQIIVFGLPHGLLKTSTEHMLMVKVLLPEAIQLIKELNDFISKENNSVEQTRVGQEYGMNIDGSPLTRMV